MNNVHQYANVDLVPCSCFSLLDKRKLDPHRPGKVTGPVINISSQEVYGVHMRSDTDSALRRKFRDLVAVNLIIVTPVRIIARLVCLIIGTWAKEAYREAVLSWRIQRLECYKANNLGQAPKKAAFIFHFFSHSIVYFTRDLIKFLTLPLAAVLLELTALYGLVFPLDGRILFASVEDAWSLDCEIQSKYLLYAANYQAPCMQPTSVAKQKNFWSIFSDYHPQTLRSLCRSIEQSQRYCSAYFKDIDFMAVALFRKHVRIFSYSDLNETTDKGFIKQGSMLLEKTREILMDLKLNLEVLVKNCDEAVDLEINLNDVALPKDNRENSIKAFQKLSEESLGLLKSLTLQVVPELSFSSALDDNVFV